MVGRITPLFSSIQGKVSWSAIDCGIGGRSNPGRTPLWKTDKGTARALLRSGDHPDLRVAKGLENCGLIEDAYSVQSLLAASLDLGPGVPQTDCPVEHQLLGSRSGIYAEVAQAFELIPGACIGVTEARFHLTAD